MAVVGDADLQPVFLLASPRAGQNESPVLAGGMFRDREAVNLAGIGGEIDPPQRFRLGISKRPPRPHLRWARPRRATVWRTWRWCAWLRRAALSRAAAGAPTAGTPAAGAAIAFLLKLDDLGARRPFETRAVANLAGHLVAERNFVLGKIPRDVELHAVRVPGQTD